MRVGLYGGSFNPIHFGHLRSAVEVREALELDEVWFIPARLSPHKDAAEIAPGEDRLRLLELALAGAPGLRVEPIELERPGPSFTIDTVRALQARDPAAELCLVLGFDAYRELHTWHEYDALVAACDLVVTSRPPRHLEREAMLLPADLPIAVTRAFCYDPERRCFAHDSGRCLRFVPVTSLDISASDLRARIRAGRSIRFLTPPEVVDHVERRGLYREATS